MSAPSACWVTLLPEVLNKITPADISDPQELIARAKALSDGTENDDYRPGV